ncbi:hypothetical protein [Kordia jejudonensis]|uniref:hypothetical protein n=1 Tax=Kordia jejudonensis TaxID=1348245 RepID=UPI0006296D2C|nr:hypothetical protein [Kordia jejudonensis]
MKTSLKPLLYSFIMLISCVSIAQNKNYQLETQYMNCMYGIFEDNGVKLQKLIKKAEQQLIDTKLLKDTSGESYIALFQNIEEAVKGNMGNLEISDYVIKGMSNNKKIKEYMECMNGLMESAEFKESKLSKFIQLSSSGNNNPDLKTLANKLLAIFEPKDFSNDFYKYLTFSFLDKFNKANKTGVNASKG